MASKPTTDEEHDHFLFHKDCQQLHLMNSRRIPRSLKNFRGLILLGLAILLLSALWIRSSMKAGVLLIAYNFPVPGEARICSTAGSLYLTLRSGTSSRPNLYIFDLPFPGPNFPNTEHLDFGSSSPVFPGPTFVFDSDSRGWLLTVSMPFWLAILSAILLILIIFRKRD